RAKSDFLGNAAALLFPVDWPEPFGLSMIEAMACGTPVLAFRCGSVAEIVDPGITGFIVDSMDEAIRTLPAVLALDRRAVRQRFEQRFSAARMAKDYIHVYRSLLKRPSLPEHESAMARLQPEMEKGMNLRGFLAIQSGALPQFSLHTAAERPFYFPATGPASRPRRTLKHGDTFIVVDSHGDIGASPGGTDGLFYCDTRFLSRLELLLNGVQPLLLGSNVRDDNSQLTVDLTNPDIYFDQRLVLPKDTLHLVRTIFLWHDTPYQRVALPHYGDNAVDLQLTIVFDSDFADLFEVRGLHRSKHGRIDHACGADTGVLTYSGLDGKRRQSTLNFDPQPA